MMANEKTSLTHHTMMGMKLWKATEDENMNCKQQRRLLLSKYKADCIMECFKEKNKPQQSMCHRDWQSQHTMHI